MEKERTGLRSLFAGYCRHPTAWDELFDSSGGPHPAYRLLVDGLDQLGVGEFQKRRVSADLAFVNQGVTFSVYSDRRGVEKIFPFDLIPRPIPAGEWHSVEAGPIQRLRALNLFLHTVYSAQPISCVSPIPPHPRLLPNAVF